MDKTPSPNANPISGQKVTGGRPISGVAIGILMLEARFPRIMGDMGNAQSWDFPVLYKIVRGATPDRVIRQKGSGLLDDFIAAGQELVRDGAQAITTNCGFLSLYQNSLADHLPVPVVTSNLIQIAMINSILPAGKRAGILTISAQNLTSAHLSQIGVALDTPIGTTEGRGEFSRVILDNELTLDLDAARAENVAAAMELVSCHGEIGALVLECTNMTPYAADIAEAIRLPVFTMVDFVCWLHGAVVPRRFG